MRSINVITEGNALLKEHQIHEDFFRIIANQVFDYTDADNIAITIIITDNPEITQINYRFRNKNQPTDVIAFAYREEPFPSIGEGPEELGDIYISIDKAKEQAEEYSVTIADELRRLTIHGLLHLLGYDHERSSEDETEMYKLEDTLFNLK